jgi:hypothetical protein
MAPSSRFGPGDGRAHRRTEPGRTYQVPTCTAVAPRRTTHVAATLVDVPMNAGLVGRLVVLATLIVRLVACAGASGPSFDPTGPCTTDGKASGAYPELETRLPSTYRGEAPSLVDSGRNCSAQALGPLSALGYDEVRFAGATWSFGAERAVVLAVFTAPGLRVADMAEFYEQTARDTPRMEVLDDAEPTIAGRVGWRLDAKRVDRLQTIVVWPAADPDVVNVVVSNDLPDARIDEAIEAFGDR